MLYWRFYVRKCENGNGVFTQTVNEVGGNRTIKIPGIKLSENNKTIGLVEAQVYPELSKMTSDSILLNIRLEEDTIDRTIPSVVKEIQYHASMDVYTLGDLVLEDEKEGTRQSAVSLAQAIHNYYAQMIKKDYELQDARNILLTWCSLGSVDMFPYKDIARGMNSEADMERFPLTYIRYMKNTDGTEKKHFLQCASFMGLTRKEAAFNKIVAPTEFNRFAVIWLGKKLDATLEIRNKIVKELKRPETAKESANAMTLLVCTMFGMRLACDHMNPLKLTPSQTLAATLAGNQLLSGPPPLLKPVILYAHAFLSNCKERFATLPSSKKTLLDKIIGSLKIMPRMPHLSEIRKQERSFDILSNRISIFLHHTYAISLIKEKTGEFRDEALYSLVMGQEKDATHAPDLNKILEELSLFTRVVKDKKTLVDVVDEEIRNVFDFTKRIMKDKERITCDDLLNEDAYTPENIERLKFSVELWPIIVSLRTLEDVLKVSRNRATFFCQDNPERTQSNPRNSDTSPAPSRPSRRSHSVRPSR